MMTSLDQSKKWRWAAGVIVGLVGLNMLVWVNDESSQSVTDQTHTQLSTNLQINLPVMQAMQGAHRDIFAGRLAPVNRTVTSNTPITNTGESVATNETPSAVPQDRFQTWTQQATYVGYLKQGTEAQGLMMNGEQSEVVKEGSQLNGQYRIVSIEPEQMEVIDIQTGRKQIMTINQSP